MELQSLVKKVAAVRVKGLSLYTTLHHSRCACLKHKDKQAHLERCNVVYKLKNYIVTDVLACPYTLKCKEYQAHLEQCNVVLIQLNTSTSKLVNLS